MLPIHAVLARRALNCALFLQSASLLINAPIDTIGAIAPLPLGELVAVAERVGPRVRSRGADHPLA